MQTNVLAHALSERAKGGHPGGAVAHRLAQSEGWRAFDVVCTSGPEDRAFEERRDYVSIALVIAGTFRYRSPCGSALLAPGSLLLGESGQCFECGHEHGRGDRSIAFHYDPDFFETVAGAIPGVRRLSFGMPAIPPLRWFSALAAEIELAADGDELRSVEELALRLAGGILRLAADAPALRAPGNLDQRRIGRVLRHIEAHSEEPLTIADLARLAGMSRYHFLRVFRMLIGVTPHQYLIRTRLQRAAAELRRGEDSIASIAFASGFGDLSTFNHAFHETFEHTPSRYREAGRRGRLPN